jgi:hypothetical protein
MQKPTFPLGVLASACVAAVLVACGGGGADNSSGSGAIAVTPPPPILLGTSTVSGTVTGFGSVVVDGVRIDDKLVAAFKERFDGALSQVELKLGQHVEVEHDGSLVATKIRVSAEVEGSVSAVDAVAKTVTVLGQTITINADPALGPVTVFGTPYAKLDDIKVADAVEVHGLIKIDAAGKVTLQATRIEKKVAATTDLVNGIVFDQVASSHTFKLGKLTIDYTNATVLPAGAVIANGSEVSVAIPAGTVEQGVPVKATAIKVKDRKAESQGKEVELGGSVSAFDTASKILTVNGIKVDVSAAKFDQTGKGLADLKPGAYIVVKGMYNDAKVLKATTVVIRGVDQDVGKDVELHGTIVDFKSMSDFKLRGVSVDASGAVIDTASCAGVVNFGNETQIVAFGSLNAAGVVKIVSVKCEKVAENVVVVTRQGKVSKADAASKTFAITTTKETLTVKWTDATTFVDIDVASLNDKNVTVEAIVTSTGLQAKKVSLIK